MSGQIRDELFNLVFSSGRNNLDASAGVQDASAEAMALCEIPSGRPETYSLNKALDMDGKGFFWSLCNGVGIDHGGPHGIGRQVGSGVRGQNHSFI